MMRMSENRSVTVLKPEEVSAVSAFVEGFEINPPNDSKALSDWI